MNSIMIAEPAAKILGFIAEATRTAWEPLLKLVRSLANKIRNRLPNNKAATPLLQPLHLAENPHGDTLYVAAHA